MKAISKSLLLFIIGAFMSAPGNSQAPDHFRWSQRNAHELNYDRRINSSPDLSASERQALLDFLLKKFKALRDNGDLMLQDTSDRELLKLAREMRVEKVDLGGDRRYNFILQGYGLGACGGTGNCMVLIVQTTPAGVQLLLDSNEEHGGFELFTIRQWLTNGYKDVVPAAHVSATERYLVWFRFANGRYRRYRCYHLSWMSDNLEPLKTPNIEKDRCKDFFSPEEGKYAHKP